MSDTINVDEYGISRYPVTADKFGVRPVSEDTPVAEIPVHTYGKVVLVSCYGSDEMIVDAARTSYGAGTKKTRGAKALIRYLVRHQHSSPLEQAVVTFYLRMPIFVARQLVRHRTARLNEYSARYSVLSDDFYIPHKSDLGSQSTSNRQGREGLIIEGDAEEIQQSMFNAQQQAMDTYKMLLEQYGLTRELARVVTPVGSYTEMYWQIDLNNLLRFLKLRLDPHAQQEIRDFAEAMFRCVEPYYPSIFGAFHDYVLRAYTLSALEIDMLRDVLSYALAGNGFILPENHYGMSEREHLEASNFIKSIFKR